MSLEALTFARRLSAEGGGVPVDAVVVGDIGDELRKELATYGVRTAYQVGGDAVAAYSGAGWASAILSCCCQRRARLRAARSSRDLACCWWAISMAR